MTRISLPPLAIRAAGALARRVLGIIAVGLGLGLLADLAGAQQPGPPVLGLPLRCEPGVDCWIANYADVAPGPEVRDYACGLLAYEGHKGTDFAIRTLADMRAGVEVIAAAPGIVEGLRNGIDDIGFRETGRQSVAGTECGNGVVVAHGGGWKTQYCHMLKGSVTVTSGQKVAAGDVLGKVGLSGLTEFPHVHLEVRHNDTVVDPFAGLDRKAFCGLGPNPLWSKTLLAKLAYRPTMIYNIGFAPDAPQADAVRNGRYRDTVLPATSQALVLWTEIFGVQVGDKLDLVITGPDGAVLHNRSTQLQRNQARLYQFSGMPRAAAGWSSGTYRGTVIVSREKDKLGPGRYTAETAVDIR